MKVVFVAIALLAVVYSITCRDAIEQEWSSFKAVYEKSYTDESEEQLRRQIFSDNKKLIDRHNARYLTGAESYEMGINQFTDLRRQEFMNFVCSRNATIPKADFVFKPPENLVLPESMDWKAKGAVTGVKHQGDCGCCWAFAAVASIESHYFIKFKKLIELSEQQLLDCSSQPPYKNEGCKCGYPHEALRYVQENKGINERSVYPYEGKKGSCRFHKDKVAATIQGSVQVKFADEAALQAAVADKGPVLVTVDVQNLQHYRAGVYNQACTGKPYYHSILLVGYGRDKGQDYWLLKNSWGNWGEAGYFRMARNSHNLCSVASWPFYPLM